MNTFQTNIKEIALNNLEASIEILKRNLMYFERDVKLFKESEANADSVHLLITQMDKVTRNLQSTSTDFTEVGRDFTTLKVALEFDLDYARNKIKGE